MAGHKHAALMAEYAKDAAETDKPWERWQSQKDYGPGCWSDCDRHPKWYPDSDYRRKPRTLTIAGAEIEAPLVNAEHGSYAYATDATGEPVRVRICFGDKDHATALANSRLFATPEAAKAAYDAITALLTGKDAA